MIVGFTLNSTPAFPNVICQVLCNVQEYRDRHGWNCGLVQLPGGPIRPYDDLPEVFRARYASFLRTHSLQQVKGKFLRKETGFLSVLCAGRHTGTAWCRCMNFTVSLLVLKILLLGAGSSEDINVILDTKLCRTCTYLLAAWFCNARNLRSSSLTQSFALRQWSVAPIPI